MITVYWLFVSYRNWIIILSIAIFIICKIIHGTVGNTDGQILQRLQSFKSISTVGLIKKWTFYLLFVAEKRWKRHKHSEKTLLE